MKSHTDIGNNAFFPGQYYSWTQEKVIDANTSSNVIIQFVTYDDEPEYRFISAYMFDGAKLSELVSFPTIYINYLSGGSAIGDNILFGLDEIPSNYLVTLTDKASTNVTMSFNASNMRFEYQYGVSGLSDRVHISAFEPDTMTEIYYGSQELDVDLSQITAPVITPPTSGNTAGDNLSGNNLSGNITSGNTTSGNIIGSDNLILSDNLIPSDNLISSGNTIGSGNSSGNSSGNGITLPPPSGNIIPPDLRPSDNIINSGNTITSGNTTGNNMSGNGNTPTPDNGPPNTTDDKKDEVAQVQKSINVTLISQESYFVGDNIIFSVSANNTTATEVFAKQGQKSYEVILLNSDALSEQYQFTPAKPGLFRLGASNGATKRKDQVAGEVTVRVKPNPQITYVPQDFDEEKEFELLNLTNNLDQEKLDRVNTIATAISSDNTDSELAEVFDSVEEDIRETMKLVMMQSVEKGKKRELKGNKSVLHLSRLSDNVTQFAASSDNLTLDLGNLPGGAAVSVEINDFQGNISISDNTNNSGNTNTVTVASPVFSIDLMADSDELTEQEVDITVPLSVIQTNTERLKLIHFYDDAVTVKEYLDVTIEEIDGVKYCKSRTTSLSPFVFVEDTEVEATTTAGVSGGGGCLLK